MNTIDLGLIKVALEELVGAKLRHLDPDSLSDCIPGLEWSPLPASAASSDVEAERALGFSAQAEDEVLYFVTEASFAGQGGGFVVRQGELCGFFEEHLQRFGERVFSGGDVIVWSGERKRIWLWHHEGVFTTATFGRGSQPVE